MGALGDELRRLQARRGIHAEHPERLLGPHLARLAGLTGTESAPEVRRMVASTLHDLSRDLPDDLRTAFLAGMGVHERVKGPVLERRLEQAAEELFTSTRTVRRYLKQAVERLEAENAALPGAEGRGRSHGYAPSGWWLGRLKATLHLDTGVVHAVEEREIVAVADDLDQVVVSAQVPRHGTGDAGPHEATLECLEGAAAMMRERPTDTYFRHHVRLSRVLRAGERHTLAVRLSIPYGQAMKPEYVFRPLRRCDRFDLCVRFGPLRPGRVWAVPGVPNGVVEDLPRSPIAPDADGNCSVGFSTLRPGLAYGLRWD